MNTRSLFYNLPFYPCGENHGKFLRICEFWPKLKYCKACSVVLWLNPVVIGFQSVEFLMDEECLRENGKLDSWVNSDDGSRGIKNAMPLREHPGVRCIEPLRFEHGFGWAKPIIQYGPSPKVHLFDVTRAITHRTGIYYLTGTQMLTDAPNPDEVNLFMDCFNGARKQLYHVVKPSSHSVQYRSPLWITPAIERAKERAERKRNAAIQARIARDAEMLRSAGEAIILRSRVEHLESELKKLRRLNKTRFSEPKKKTPTILKAIAAATV